MNLEYDYYAVKYLARTALMSEEEADTIASYCAFIEDSDTAAEIRTDYANLSQEVIDRNLYQEDESGQVRLVLPKTTVLKAGDVAGDYKNPDTQWNALLPFHYFPSKPQDKKEPEDYFMVFIHDIQTNFMLKTQFELAKEEFHSKDSSCKERGMMRLGVLAHIVAASAANEWLNPFESWINEVELLNADDYHTGAEYVNDNAKHFDKEELAKNPPVGHAKLGTATTDSSICGNFKQQQSIDVPFKVRNHQYGFDENVMRASKTIFNMLLMVRGKEPEHHKSDLDGAMRLIIATADKWRRGEPELCTVWKQKISLPYDYQYSNMRIKLSKATGISSLCNFIVVVDDFRKAVIKPLTALSRLADHIAVENRIASNDKGLLCVSPVHLTDGSIPEISVLAYTSDEHVTKVQTNLYNSQQRLMESWSNDFDKADCKAGYYEQKLSLDFCSQGAYTLTSALIQPQPSGAEPGTSEVLGIQKEFVLSAPSGRMILRIPGTAQNENKVLIGNGFALGDLNYPDNFPYQREGETWLDLYLPVYAEILLDGLDTLLGIKTLELSFVSSRGIKLYHSGAPLHRRIVQEEQRAAVFFPAEWKRSFSSNAASELYGNLELKAQLWVHTEAGARLATLEEKSKIEISLLWQS